MKLLTSLQTRIKNLFKISSRLKVEILFFLILCIGIFARVWRVNYLPPGLIADEASTAVDAFSLLHYGYDHNGTSFPIHFISFGSGQNALYGYLLIPFIAFLGLNLITVKLPMLICGILSLPLLFWVTKKTFDKRVALISMFFLSISPWHIMLSRIGLESNLLPFIFLSGYALLLKSFENGRWFIAATTVFAVCLYSYVTAYLIIPVFLGSTFFILYRKNRIDKKYLAAGLVSFILTAIPIGLFIFINLNGLNTIKVGSITIPQLPTQPRFESETVGLANQPFQVLIRNIWTLMTLLFNQYDGIIYNTIKPFGYFYGITFPLAIIGISISLRTWKSSKPAETLLLYAWLGAPVIFGILQPVNINRINIIFIPIIICIALGVDWLGKKIKPLLPLAVTGFLIAFIAFTIVYHGIAYRDMADIKFHTGLLSAIQYARSAGQGPICVTDRIDMPYIFVLFVEKTDPANYINSIQYVEESSPFRNVRSLLRYTFGKENCENSRDTVYLFRKDDGFPKTGRKYDVEFFHEFLVFSPKP